MNIDLDAKTTGDLNFSTDSIYLLFVMEETPECVWNDLEHVDNVRINGNLLSEAITI